MMDLDFMRGQLIMPEQRWSPFILSAKNNKNSRLQLPQKILLMQLRYWPPTIHTALSDAPQQIAHHPHTLQYAKAEDRNQWLLQKWIGEKSNKAILAEIILYT